MIASTSLYLDERHRPFPFNNQINIAVTAPETTLNHAPSLSLEPPLRDSLSQLSKRLRGR